MIELISFMVYRFKVQFCTFARSSERERMASVCFWVQDSVSDAYTIIQNALPVSVDVCKTFRIEIICNNTDKIRTKKYYCSVK